MTQNLYMYGRKHYDTSVQFMLWNARRVNALLFDQQFGAYCEVLGDKSTCPCLCIRQETEQILSFSTRNRNKNKNNDPQRQPTLDTNC